MNMRRISFALGLCFGLCGVATQARAEQEVQFLSVSGGITETGFGTALLENPAGLAGIDRFRLGLQVGSTPNGDNNSENGNGGSSNPAFLGGLMWGNQTVGVAALVDHQTSSGNGAYTNALYGMGVYASPIKTSFGVSVVTPISPGGSTNFNAGLKIGLAPSFDFGFDVFGLNGGPSQYGFGLGYHLAPMVVLVDDFAADHTFGNLAMQPGLEIGSSFAALSVSYGFAFSGNVMESQISDGFSVGAGIHSGNVSLQLYYQHVYKYYAALSLGI
jgi:hypothetical protein